MKLMHLHICELTVVCFLDGKGASRVVLPIRIQNCNVGVGTESLKLLSPFHVMC